MKTLNLVVRWGLGIHGAIHMVEFINLIEHAWMSAFFTLIAGSLMLAGALLIPKSCLRYQIFNKKLNWN